MNVSPLRGEEKDGSEPFDQSSKRLRDLKLKVKADGS
jgi:hypothetical protein